MDDLDEIFNEMALEFKMLDHPIPLELIKKKYNPTAKLLDFTFHSNKISYLPMSSLIKLNPKILLLRKQELTEIPNDIRFLNKLERLNIDSNRLSVIPKELFRSSIKILNLNNNNIRKIPEEIGEMKSLSELYLFNNHITNLPSSLGELENLRVLYLSGNQLIDLPDELGKLKNLKKIWLENNKFTRIDEATASVLEILHKNGCQINF